MKFDHTFRGALAALALTLPFQLLAAPGAHGPNGEHLDGPTGSAPAAGAAPRLEAKSEAFELVGRLAGGELSMFINRFETNEPVDGAELELELGTLKASAPFHADQGDYAVADEAFLKALAAPGPHAIVFTLTAGSEVDLLEATLDVPKPAPGLARDDHGHLRERLAMVAAVVALLVALVVAAVFLARRRKARLASGGAR